MSANVGDFLQFGGGFSSMQSGEIPIRHEFYVAIKDFNADDTEQPISRDRVRILAFRTGELILMTIEPNKAGWFEGYRHNDPERLCGISHKSFLKKINFK